MKCEKGKLKTFGILSANVETTTFSIAYAVARGGIPVTVYAPMDVNNQKANDHYLRAISDIPGVDVITDLAGPTCDVLYIEMWRQTPRQWLRQFASATPQLGFIFPGGRVHNDLRFIKSEVGDSKRFFPWVLRGRSIGYVDGHPSIDLYMLIGRRFFLGIDVHSKFLLDPSLNRRMFGWQWTPRALRPHRLNFLGNNLPETRNAILSAIKGELEASHITLNSAIEALSSGGSVVWSVNNAVGGEKFIEILDRCDFTLCPPGYARVTHRVVEALVCGSIPILDEDDLRLYTLPLKEDENCLAVRGGDWASAVRKALACSSEDLFKMREAILSLRHDYLTVDAWTRRMRQRLGVNEMSST